MSKHLSHHYMPKSEESARLKGCLVLFGFIGIMGALVALFIYLFGG